MKSLFASLLMLSSLSAFAYNSEYSKLVPGKEVLVDSANKGIISLTLDTKSKSSTATPKVTIENQWGNFECEYKQTLLLHSGFNVDTKVFKKTWEVQIAWLPGADLSGCIVKVSYPGMEDSRASIFMNY